MNRTTPSPPTAIIPVTTFTLPQWEALLAPRERYRRERDFFDARERAHLRFMRWLYQTGHQAAVRSDARVGYLLNAA